MNATATKDEEAPIKSARIPQRPTRLLPEHQEQLREAKLDFGARFRIETDETAILNQFFEEEFQAWKAKKLAAQKKQRSPQ
jgi:tRNA G46 methylase TrmB